MPRFSANLSMLFNDVAFPMRFARAAAAGFEAVEFMFPYDWPRDLLTANLARDQLVLVLHNLPAGDWTAGERGIACLPGREGEFQIDRIPVFACTGRLHIAGAFEARAPRLGKADNAHAGDTASAVGVFDHIDHGLTAAQR